MFGTLEFGTGVSYCGGVTEGVSSSVIKIMILDLMNYFQLANRHLF